MQKVSTKPHAVEPSLSVPASIHHKEYAGSDDHTDDGVTYYLPAGSRHDSIYWTVPA